MLQEGFGRSAAKKRGLGGDPRPKSRGHLLLLLLLPTLHHTDGRITHTRKDIYTRDISNSSSTGSALFAMGYAYAHVPEISTSCTEPAREPWGAAPMVMTATPKNITRNVPGPENAILGTVPHDLHRPRPMALGHRIVSIPCGAVMVPWLLRHPRCPKRALHVSPCFL